MDFGISKIGQQGHATPVTPMRYTGVGAQEQQGVFAQAFRGKGVSQPYGATQGLAARLDAINCELSPKNPGDGIGKKVDYLA